MFGFKVFTNNTKKESLENKSGNRFASLVYMEVILNIFESLKRSVGLISSPSQQPVKVWVKQFGKITALEISIININYVNFDGLIGFINNKRKERCDFHAPIEGIYTCANCDEASLCEFEANVPIPVEGQIGFSSQNPYYYKVENDTANTGKRRKLEPELFQVSTFTKPVSDCKNIPYDNDHVFVDLERAADDCVAIVLSQLPLQTTLLQYRVPPLVLMRFSRGGKTMTLANVLEKIKGRNDVHPIIITFNGNGSTQFQRRYGETDAESILRLIAAQLGDYTPAQIPNLVVDREALDQHLGDNVVLLIDELNNLGVPLDSDAAELLRTMFLDRAGRFLVFTSHYPVSIEAEAGKASEYLGSIRNIPSSLRGISTVNLSLASSLAELRGMSPACSALTEERAAWYAYIPSLIYSTMNDTGINGVLTPSARFRQMNITVETDQKLDVLKRFVGELLSGQRDPVVAQYYSAFASLGANSLVSYPLCYVKEIFNQLNILKSIKVLLNILYKLEIHLNSKHSGLAWECIVEVAIILRMLEAHWGLSGPFDMVTVGTKPGLDFHTLPDECDTLEKGKDYIDSRVLINCNSPTLFYVDSNNACYPDSVQAREVEGFLVYSSGNSTPAKIVGFQMKTADVKPSNNIDMSVINGGAILIRGRALAKNPRKPKDGWKYLTSRDVRNLLGNSLSLAIPRDWLQDPN